MLSLAGFCSCVECRMVWTWRWSGMAEMHNCCSQALHRRSPSCAHNPISSRNSAAHRTSIFLLSRQGIPGQSKPFTARDSPLREDERCTRMQRRASRTTSLCSSCCIVHARSANPHSILKDGVCTVAWASSVKVAVQCACESPHYELPSKQCACDEAREMLMSGCALGFEQAPYFDYQHIVLCEQNQAQTDSSVR